MTVGFLGLGAMGYPMAGHIARGFDTLVWNRTASVAERHQGEFRSVAAPSPCDVVRGSDVILSCLPTSAVVDAVMTQCLGALRPDQVWVDCTSGHPDAARAAEARLKERGAGWLDAPVSGGPGGAKAGALTVMAGGADSVLDAVLPVLDTFAAKVIHVGPTGSGFAVKAVNNAVMAINLWGAAEGLLALQTQGIDPNVALSVLNASSGRSNATENLLAEPLSTDAYPLRFKLSLLHKDAGIARDVAWAANAPAPLTVLMTELLGMARAGLPEDADYLEVVRALRAWRRPPPG